MSSSEMEASSSNMDSNVDQQQQDSYVENNDDVHETNSKKRKLSQQQQNKNDENKKYKLEDRLGGILCCAVCLDLPTASVYQVRLLLHFFLLFITIFL